MRFTKKQKRNQFLNHTFRKISNLIDEDKFDDAQTLIQFLYDSPEYNTYEWYTEKTPVDAQLAHYSTLIQMMRN
jgi:DNA phosphorothioation-dependent restriction protein DptG